MKENGLGLSEEKSKYEGKCTVLKIMCFEGKNIHFSRKVAKKRRP